MPISVANSVPSLPSHRESGRVQFNKTDYGKPFTGKTVDPTKSEFVVPRPTGRNHRNKRRRRKQGRLTNPSPEVQPASYRAHLGKVVTCPAIDVGRDANIVRCPVKVKPQSKRTPPQLAKHPDVDTTPLANRESEPTRTRNADDAHTSLTTSAVCRLPAIVAPQGHVTTSTAPADARDVVDTPLLPLHNYIMSDRLAKDQQTFLKLSTNLSVPCPDANAMVHIEKRLVEINNMAKPRCDNRYVLDRYSEEVKNRIKRIDNMNAAELQLLTKNFRHSARDKIIWTARITITLLRGFKSRKIYFEQSNDNKSKVTKDRRKSVMKASVVEKLIKSSLTEDMQLCLTTRPRFRDKQMVDKILWLLKAKGTFLNLFPAEMETEVARHVAYESYDDGRIIASQGTKPERLYFIIGGKMTKYRKYNLWTGHIIKSMGYLVKGETTNYQEMDEGWIREDSLVSNSNLEVIFLDKSACKMLQHSISGPPYEYLRTLDLFDFNENIFIDHSDAIDFVYYEKNTIIVKDTNRTPWIHVVKSGSVKVVRSQEILDSGSLNQNRFQCSRVEQIGFGRTFSHAKAMLGVAARQKKAKSERKLQLPKINSFLTNKNGDGGRDGVTTRSSGIGVSAKSIQSSRRHSQNPSITLASEDMNRNKVLLSPDLSSVVSDVDSSEYNGSCESNVEAKSNLPYKMARESTCVDLTLRKKSNLKQFMDSKDKSNFESSNHQIRGSQGELSKANRDSTVKCSRNNVTSGMVDQNKEKPSRLQIANATFRNGYVIVDRLFSDNIFGLDHLHQTRASEPIGLTLISSGAEVVRVNKRFYLQYASHNAMLKIETMQRGYMSEQNVQDILYKRETWKHYKKALLGGTLNTLNHQHQIPATMISSRF